MEEDIYKRVALAINAWLHDQITVRKKDLSAYELSDKRLEWAFQTASKEEAAWFFHIKQRSPIKQAAAICVGLATEQPLYVVAGRGSPQSERMAALDNARLAFDCARYLVATSSFDCAPAVKPPFEIRYPSHHFKNEVHWSLVCEETGRPEITTPGVAYLLELLLYSCPKGRQLFGSLDHPPRRASEAPAQ